MRIGIGSRNAAKVAALRECIAEYPLLSSARVIEMDAHSGVSEQPRTLEEIMRGARNRAHQSYAGNMLGVGIESGLMEVPLSSTGYMDICACTIFSGQATANGLSSAFECPPIVTSLVVRGGLDLNEAFVQSGLTDDPHIGAGDGAIGLLTHGRVTRKHYTMQAIRMALIQIEYSEIYAPQ